MVIRIPRSRPLTMTGKFFALCLLLYLTWYKEVWDDIQIVLYGLTILLTAVVLLDISSRGGISLKNVPAILKMYLRYAIYSLITGVFVARDLGIMLSSIITFLAFSLVCFDCWYISDQEGSMEWLLSAFSICAVVCALQTILRGQPYYNGVIVTTMSGHNNPNTLGLVLVLGIYGFISDLIKINKALPIKLFLLLLMSYAIVLTGSRKTLISAVLLLILWVYFYLREERRCGSINRTLWTMSLIFFGGIAVLYYYNHFYSGTASYQRILGLLGKRGTDTRASLYRDAIEFWKSSPLVGIGFNQYRIYSAHGYYSHSSYAEILSCGGIVGFLMFYIPFFEPIRIIWNNVFKRGLSPQKRYKIAMCGAVLLIELFLGVGQIFIYDLNHMLMLMIVFYEASRLEREAQNE